MAIKRERRGTKREPEEPRPNLTQPWPRVKLLTRSEPHLKPGLKGRRSPRQASDSNWKTWQIPSGGHPEATSDLNVCHLSRFRFHVICWPWSCLPFLRGLSGPKFQRTWSMDHFLGNLNSVYFWPPTTDFLGSRTNLNSVANFFALCQFDELLKW